MENDLSQALTLLAIGMITVFVVLSLVVMIGNLLIRLVNRITPQSEQMADGSTISHATIAAITTAVEVVSGGKAQITKIERE